MSKIELVTPLLARGRGEEGKVPGIRRTFARWDAELVDQNEWRYWDNIESKSQHLIEAERRDGVLRFRR